MIELRNASGHALRLSSDESVQFWNDLGYRSGDATATESTGYGDLKVAELKAEIDRRNEGRDEADLLSTDGKKDDLIATLETDDNK